MQTDLKDTMGYKGFIMSDWWALHAFSALKGREHATINPRVMPPVLSLNAPDRYAKIFL